MNDLDSTKQEPSEQAPQKGQLDYSTVYGSNEPVKQAQEPASADGEITDAECAELDAAYAEEIELLREFYPDADMDCAEPTTELVEATKSLRLLCQRNLPEASELIMRTAADACRVTGDTDEGQKQLSALRMFLSGANADSAGDMEFLGECVKRILQARAGV